MSDQSAPAGDATPDAPVESTESAPTQDQGQQSSHDDRLTSRLDEMHQAIQQLAQYQQQEPEYEDDDYEEAPDPNEDPDAYEAWEAQQQLAELIDKQVQERLTPIQQQQQLQQRNQSWERLTEQYTQLQDNNFASNIVEAAANHADAIGLDVNRPEFVQLIELHYKAHVADEAAKRETPAGQRREVQLESNGAAGPVDRDEDIQARLIASLTEKPSI